ncbi:MULTISPECIES: hypothetical protein [unclassified Inquilinus]|uniref:hypothetical protein n=1 Tax=unclassified Inquilinus TaxID=2645927 RepID=UPI003F8FAEC2
MVVLTLAPERTGDAVALLPLVVLLLFGYRIADRADIEMGLTAVQATLHRTCNWIAGKFSRFDLSNIETFSRGEMAHALGDACATISNSYLHRQRIDATLKLAQSPDAKVVVTESGASGGLPLIWGARRHDSAVSVLAQFRPSGASIPARRVCPLASARS